MRSWHENPERADFRDNMESMENKENKENKENMKNKIELCIIDTTLRDGEQSAGIALGVNEKVEVAKLLDRMGIYQIEAGIPAMGGTEKKSMEKIIQLGLKSRISAWNRLNPADIAKSMSCGDVIIHISVPSSDLHIKHKLGRDRGWVLDNMRKCIYIARERGFEVTIGLEDASRADPGFLAELCREAWTEGADRIRYADTVGVLYRKKAYDELKLLRQSAPIDFEMHTHNDLGMALANSMAAVEAGVRFIDTTIDGIGERAGNCSFMDFVMAAKASGLGFTGVSIPELTFYEAEIIKIMKLRYRGSIYRLVKSS
jgi:homocitrate synthase NifV